ncbi:MAG TPA: glycosyltransferase family 4 protein, partial [Candidatus Solibacter sp.]|nr:glycosyltransferase family 4 protein [Candidatus Solibacter sp.]
MRILLIPSSYHPCLGGVQTVAHSLAKELMRRKHEVHVVTNRYPRSLPTAEVVGGVSVRRWLFLKPQVWTLRQRPDLFVASFYFCPHTVLGLARLVRRFRPDVINVHFPDSQVPFVLWLQRRFPFRLVVSLHGHEIERWFSDTNQSSARGSEPPQLRRLRSILRDADAVTACSQYLLDRAIELEPSLAGKSSVIHNGLDLDRFRDKTPYQHPRPYVFACGRLTHEKGFDLLLCAFAKVAPAHHGVDLIIAGDGEEQMALRQLGSQLGLNGRVKFH